MNSISGVNFVKRNFSPKKVHTSMKEKPTQKNTKKNYYLLDHRNLILLDLRNLILLDLRDLTGFK